MKRIEHRGPRSVRRRIVALAGGLVLAFGLVGLAPSAAEAGGFRSGYHGDHHRSSSFYSRPVRYYPRPRYEVHHHHERPRRYEVHHHHSGCGHHGHGHSGGHVGIQVTVPLYWSYGW